MPDILVVNEIRTLRRLTVSALKEIGYAEVLEAESCEEAKSIVAESENDLIVVFELNDQQLYDLELEWIEKFSSCSATGFPALIVTSPQYDNVLITQMKQAGVDAFILKSLEHIDKFVYRMKTAIKEIIEKKTC